MMSQLRTPQPPIGNWRTVAAFGRKPPSEEWNGAALCRGAATPAKPALANFPPTGYSPSMNRKPDPQKYYNLERYLLEEVQPRFQKNGSIGAFDFFSIVIWKANRAKSRVADKLRDVSGEDNLEQICKKLSTEIWKAKEEKDKMKILISDWHFRLPMASAILTILYPELFTVYDYRAAEQTGNGSKLVNKTSFDAIWDGYVEFRCKVNEIGKGSTMREKDRYLFGKSRMEDLADDIEHGFSDENDKA